ncbi:MAG: phosphatidylglycerophosphatase A [Planctomycetales bacterium]
MIDRIVLLLATGLGAGSAPRMPGTVGSLLGLPLAWGLQHLPWWGQIAAAALIFVIGIPICQRGALLLKSKDPGPVVFDEIAAFPVLFLFATWSWGTAVAGFLLFRIFDISKPWPCRRLETLPGGLGIMADDLAAGVYAGLALWGLTQAGIVF